MDNSTLTTTTDNATGDQIGQGYGLGILVFFFAVGSFILFCNGYTLFNLYKLKDKHKRSFLMIIGLTFSDIILGVGVVTSVPLHIYRLFYKDSMYVCATVISFTEIGVTSSLFHTFCICFERLLAVRSRTTVKRQLGLKGRIKLVGISTIVIGTYFCLWKINVPFHNELCTLPILYGEYFGLYVGVTTFAILLPLMLGTVVIYLITVWIIQTKTKKMKKRMKSINKKLTNPQTLKEINEHHNTTGSSDVQINVSKFTSNSGVPVRDLDRDFEKTNVVNSDNLPTKRDDGGLESNPISNVLNPTCPSRNNDNEKRLETVTDTTISVIETISPCIGAEGNGVAGKQETPLQPAYAKDIGIDIEAASAPCTRTMSNTTDTTGNTYFSNANMKTIKTDGICLDTNETPITDIVHKDMKTTFSNRQCIDTSEMPKNNVQLMDIETKITKPSEIVVGKREFSSNTRRNHKMKAMKIISLVVLVLVCFTGPGIAVYVVDVFCKSCVSAKIRTIVNLLWLFNSALNPCIYYFTIDEFRHSVKRTCTCSDRYITD